MLVAFGLTALISVYYTQYELASILGFFFCFIIYSHYKHSSVVMASKYYESKDFVKAKALLAEVANPERLAKNRRGYYEFMQGNIALKDQDFEEAEYHFQLASRYSVGGKNQKAYVLIHLANLALRKKNKERAEAYTKLAKELAVTSRSKEILVKIEKEISQL